LDNCGSSSSSSSSSTHSGGGNTTSSRKANAIITTSSGSIYISKLCSASFVFVQRRAHFANTATTTTNTAAPTAAAVKLHGLDKGQHAWTVFKRVKRPAVEAAHQTVGRGLAVQLHERNELPRLLGVPQQPNRAEVRVERPEQGNEVCGHKACWNAHHCHASLSPEG
jgi:hypothetical protein